MLKRLDNLNIGDGHTYHVVVDATGKVVQTACQGRWAMTVTATGSDWLDEQLQRAATNRLLEQE